MTRREQVIDLLAKVDAALDDDDIAERLSMTRNYVNAVCGQLSDQGIIDRWRGTSGRLVNKLARRVPLTTSPSGQDRIATARPRVRRTDRARDNVAALLGNFAECVSIFERSTAFSGPSLYFHERALARRRRHSSAESLLSDDCFLEYVYAVLPAWGMHRMGNQTAKVVDFEEMASSFRAAAPAIQGLWPHRITEIAESEVRNIGDQIWSVIASLRVSRSETRIVAGSKALHHALPDLVPPIDRQYTFRFFTGRKMVASDERAFLEWFPYLCEIGWRCSMEIDAAVARGGFMATGSAKVIDNAIIGFMQDSAREDPNGGLALSESP